MVGGCCCDMPPPPFRELLRMCSANIDFSVRLSSSTPPMRLFVLQTIQSVCLFVHSPRLPAFARLEESALETVLGQLRAATATAAAGLQPLPELQLIRVRVMRLPWLETAMKLSEISFSFSDTLVMEKIVVVSRCAADCGEHAADSSDIMKYIVPSLFGVLYPQLRTRFEGGISHLEPTMHAKHVKNVCGLAGWLPLCSGWVYWYSVRF